MKPGLVSIVVPVFNAERYLEETLDSVLAQSYGNFELIAVDDGSTDGSAEKIGRYLCDPRCRYSKQRNAGVSVARNQGFELSEGEFIAFLDADDVWLPGNLAAKVAFLQQHPECALVHSDTEIIDERSRRTGRIHCGREGRVLETLLLWQGDNIPSPSNVLTRRSALDQVGAFDPALSTAADQDLNFRMAARFEIGRIREVLTLYRMHGGNMHQDVGRMERDHLLVYDKARRAGLFRDDWFRRRCFSNLYLILAGSWWTAGHRLRALPWLARAVIAYPPGIGAIARKLASRLARRSPGVLTAGPLR